MPFSPSARPDKRPEFVFHFVTNLKTLFKTNKLTQMFGLMTNSPQTCFFNQTKPQNITLASILKIPVLHAPIYSHIFSKINCYNKYNRGYKVVWMHGYSSPLLFTLIC